MRHFPNVVVLCLAWLAGSAVAPAQQPASKGSAVREAFLADLNDLEMKLTGLAAAFPQNKYSWRPGNGVRSVSEVYMHVAGTNYFFLSALGVRTPNSIGEEAEKTVTQKAKVVEALKASIGAVRQGVRGLSEADLRKPTSMEGQQTTYEGSLLVIAAHMHEHLGQLIAYARMNGIVPPWS